MLALASRAADCNPVTELVQDICLQKLPPVVVILDGDKVPLDDLEALDPYVAPRS